MLITLVEIKKNISAIKDDGDECLCDVSNERGIRNNFQFAPAQSNERGISTFEMGLGVIGKVPVQHANIEQLLEHLQ